MTTNTPPVRVATVIVNYRAAELILKNIETLLDEYVALGAGKIIIVDNKSPGDDAARLSAFVAAKNLGALVEILPQRKNAGFAAGNNAALARLREEPKPPEFVFLLNPDAYIRPGAIRTLAAFLQDHPNAAVAGARLEDEDGTPRNCAFRFPSIAREFVNASGAGILARAFPKTVATFEPSVAPLEVDWVSGAAMMIRTAALADIPAMDERFFLYFEETDFMLNLAMRGWETWHVPSARVAHLAGSSTGVRHGDPARPRLPNYWFESWLHYYLKNHGRLYALAAGLAKLSGLVLYKTQRRIRGRAIELPDRILSDVALKCVARAPGFDARRGS